jgi:hypothetical protein
MMANGVIKGEEEISKQTWGISQHHQNAAF